MEDIKRQALEWLYREQKRIKISLGHLESRSGCEKCRERADLERKQAVVEHLIEIVLREDE